MIVQNQHLAETGCTMLGSGSSFSAPQGLILVPSTPAICPVQTPDDTVGCLSSWWVLSRDGERCPGKRKAHCKRVSRGMQKIPVLDGSWTGGLQALGPMSLCATGRTELVQRSLPKPFTAPLLHCYVLVLPGAHCHSSYHLPPAQTPSLAFPGWAKSSASENLCSHMCLCVSLPTSLWPPRTHHWVRVMPATGPGTSSC